MSEQLQCLPINQAFTQPNLFAGGERNLVLTAGLIAVGIAVTGMNIPAAAAGVVIWFFSMWALRKMAKADPYMSTVYLRYLKYKTYYPARSRPYRENP
ncbi:MAG: conjugal transfer protein TrbD [Magnetospirillum sp.]|nr:conjugal transfer protein TrbD [Magnetospirillum sp.]